MSTILKQSFVMIKKHVFSYDLNKKIYLDFIQVCTLWSNL